MRLFAFLMTLFGLLSSPPLLGQPSPTPPPPASTASPWLVSDTQIALAPARIVFPRLVGGLTADRNTEMSHQGTGFNSGIQYHSADQAIRATVYIYFLGLPHAGLEAFATDEVIRRVSGDRLQAGD